MRSTQLQLLDLHLLDQYHLDEYVVDKEETDQYVKDCYLFFCGCTWDVMTIKPRKKDAPYQEQVQESNI